jgi:hypothetical protein
MNVWRGSFQRCNQFVRFTNLEAPINFGTTHNEWDVRFSRRPVRKWTFWDIAECTLVEAYRCLRYAYFPHRQVSDPPSQYPLRLSSWHVITYPRLLCDHEDVFLKSVSRKEKPDVEEGQSQSPPPPPTTRLEENLCAYVNVVRIYRKQCHYLSHFSGVYWPGDYIGHCIMFVIYLWIY